MCRPQIAKENENVLTHLCDDDSLVTVIVYFVHRFSSLSNSNQCYSFRFVWITFFCFSCFCFSHHILPLETHTGRVAATNDDDDGWRRSLAILFSENGRWAIKNRNCSYFSLTCSVTFAHIAVSTTAQRERTMNKTYFIILTRFFQTLTAIWCDSETVILSVCARFHIQIRDYIFEHKIITDSKCQWNKTAAISSISVVFCFVCVCRECLSLLSETQN